MNVTVVTPHNKGRLISRTCLSIPFIVSCYFLKVSFIVDAIFKVLFIEESLFLSDHFFVKIIFIDVFNTYHCYYCFEGEIFLEGQVTENIHLHLFNVS